MRKGLLNVIISVFICTSVLNISSLNAHSNPNGWSEDIRFTYNTNSSTLSVIGVWENYIHIFWCERVPEPPTTTRDIFYKRSTDGGKTWERSKKLINTPYESIKPSIAINQNTIHMVWWDNRLGDNAIFYTRSEDNGTTWIHEINISTPNGGTRSPDIAITGNNVHVVYVMSYKLYYLNSTDNGNNWSEPQQLTGSIRDSNHPTIAVNGSNVHIVWLDHYDKHGQGTAGAIFYMNSTDNGLTWSEDINLTEMNLDAAYPYITVNGSTIHVVYSKEIAGLWQGYYRSSEDNGISWTEDVKIMDPSNDLFIDDIAFENNRLYVVGSDVYIPDKEIYFVKSIDNGQNWEDDVRFTNYSENSQNANIAVYKNKLYVVWEEYRDGNPEIYYKYYPFYPPPTNLSIDIWLNNLILNWTPPNNSPSPVSHYHIYRSTSWDGFDFSVPWINTSIDLDPIDGLLIPLRTTWNDTFAFLDESNNYFYIVRAMNNEGWNDTNMNIIGKYVISLDNGWNLISLPLAQKDTNISEVLKPINGDYNIVQWYDAKEGTWKSSTTNLTDINRTMGLWIHMNNSSNLTIIGSMPESTDIVLYEGWNLVGYPSLKLREVNDALSGINWKAVQYYDASDLNDPWKHNSTNKPNRLNDLKEMKSSCGYWVYITINDTWVRTRAVEHDKYVVWRVDGLKEKEANEYYNNPLIESPLKIENEDYFQTKVIPEEPLSKNEYNRIEISSIQLIFLIVLIFISIKLINKRQSPPNKKRAEEEGGRLHRRHKMVWGGRR
jgi:hypothetical protein